MVAYFVSSRVIKATLVIFNAEFPVFIPALAAR
jgi:hypothetical protein